MKKTSSIAPTIAAAMLFVAAVNANAATTFAWNYANTGSGEGVTTWNANTTGLISSTLHITAATAWGNTSGTTSGQPETTYGATTKFQNQLLTQYGNSLAVSTVNYGTTTLPGFEGYPDHAMDNHGPEEMILFTFDQAVQLNQLKLGFPASTTTCNGSACGTDMTILAYVGNTALPAISSLDSSAAGLGSANFTKFAFTANPSNVNGGVTSGFNTGTGAVSSKYWLVGAYNKWLGGGLSGDNDYVKLAGLGGVSGTTTGGGGGGGIPEPSSLALVGLGLIGGMRRWKIRKA